MCIPAQQQRRAKSNSISYSVHGLLGRDALWFLGPPRVGSGSNKKIFGPSNKGGPAKNLEDNIGKTNSYSQSGFGLV
jgi:hypothetical protein